MNLSPAVISEDNFHWFLLVEVDAEVEPKLFYRALAIPIIGFVRLENSIGLMEQSYQVNMSILCVMYLFISLLNKYI